MKSSLSVKITGLLSLLMLYSPVTFSMAEDSADHLCFVGGIAFGAVFTGLFAVYLNRHYHKKYQKKSKQLKQAKSDAQVTAQKMKALAKEQQDSQDLLEERVQERTLELNIALQELESANEELERKNVLDELTGLHNRRFYDQKILAEYRRSRRNLTALSLILIDIDHFKSVNDNYGHLAGDQCLIWLAKYIKQSLKRSADKAFRYGGEEFCLILPNTDAEGAFLLAEQLREVITKQSFKFQEIEIALTISCGIATYQQQKDVGPEQIFAAADKALYQAKGDGRNQTKQHLFIE